MMTEPTFDELDQRGREAIRTEDLNDEILEVLQKVSAPVRSVALNYLMDDTGTD